MVKKRVFGKGRIYKSLGLKVFHKGKQRMMFGKLRENSMKYK